jgi:PAS domain S-box-containing protein/putative nucleotidyltransferase with HDIG domain
MAKRGPNALVRGLADVRQGTHLCQFYKTKKELTDVLIPFFKTGIDNNELCLWITSDPLSDTEARRAIGQVLPACDDLMARGQMRVLDHSDWYMRNGVVDLQKSSEAFSHEVKRAVNVGFRGVRMATNLSWLDKKDWSTFSDYEDHADSFVSVRPMRVICSYPLARCGAMEVIDVVRSHHSVIVKQGRRWQLVKSSGHRMIRRLLKETDRRYEDLFANTMDGMVVFDLETMKVILANQAAAAIAGFDSPEEMARDDVLNRVSDVDRDRFSVLLAIALRKEQSPLVEDVRLMTKDGRDVWLNIICKKIDYQGKPAGLVAFRDVTDRKRAEEGLLDSQEKNRLLIENANEGIVVIQDEVVKFANPKTQELFGCTAQELVLKPVKDVVHPEDRGTVMEQHFKRLNGDEVPDVHEFRIVDKAGSTKWVELNGVLQSWGGRPADLCFVRDITQRKMAERALYQSEERFRNLVENTSDWVWEVDTAGIYTYVGPRVRNILGYEPDEVLGKTPFHFMTAQESARIAGIFESCVAAKKPFAFVENVCLRKDGRTVSVERSAVPFFDAAGSVCGFRGIDRDISERKRSEDKLQSSYRRLEDTLDGVIQAMALTVETRDRRTGGHQRRVTELAHAIATEIGLSKERSRGVRIAGLLHDVGKITIPTEILSKPGRLSDMEFAIIKTHSKAGYDILKSIDFPWPVADIVVQHHERMDGSGYPSGLKGEQTALEARILAVADVVEAMVSHRPHRPALGTDQAMQEITDNRGRLYDANVVDACLTLFNRGSFRFADQGV